MNPFSGAAAVDFGAFLDHGHGCKLWGRNRSLAHLEGHGKSGAKVCADATCRNTVRAIPI